MQFTRYQALYFKQCIRIGRYDNQTDQNRLLSVLFQTQEIRFADMVRVAELLLTKAARQDGNMDEKSIQIHSSLQVRMSRQTLAPLPSIGIESLSPAVLKPIDFP